MTDTLDKSAARWPLLALVFLGIPLGVGVSCINERGDFDARHLARQEVLAATGLAFVGSVLCSVKTLQLSQTPSAGKETMPIRRRRSLTENPL